MSAPASGEDANPSLPDDPVRTVTAWSPLYASRDDHLDALARVMTTQDLGALLVVTRDGRTGIVTERDVVRALADGTAQADWVADVMTGDAVTVDAETTIRDVALLMTEAGVRHMVVTDASDANHVGIVSMRDLLPALAG